MKTTVLVLFATLLFALDMRGQEPPHLKSSSDSLLLNGGFEIPESLSFLDEWRPDFKAMEPVKTKKKIAQKSVVVVDPNHLPERVSVLTNNTLRLSSVFIISNGQAWNWGQKLDSHLDARTLSFPMRR